ncbi:hypothetical protein CES85_1671 [Ochrobactrum quorumnocens]|uniref:Uncharacterized protein n=1 Tax=Ochrobactrum quorumnocens TaxID=271865 RepID=A0A248ULX7_9HYPH|nr:hypothetical protein CES85_1046 [[Ochrobactrum] quorumnocens]ASV87632.1 hypothetical protein CES85_1671 [[Ochrobactrum] quorumnocens]
MLKQALDHCRTARRGSNPSSLRNSSTSFRTRRRGMGRH